MYTVGRFSQEFVRSKSLFVQHEKVKMNEFDRRVEHEKLCSAKRREEYRLSSV